MANAPTLTDDDIGGFLGRLDEYRGTLGEKDQVLLDAMVMAASGKKDEEDESTKPFWVAVNPRGPAGGPGYGVAAGGPYGAYGYGGYGGYGGYAAGWAVSPWGAAYGRYW